MTPPSSFETRAVRRRSLRCSRTRSPQHPLGSSGPTRLLCSAHGLRRSRRPRRRPSSDRCRIRRRARHLWGAITPSELKRHALPPTERLAERRRNRSDDEGRRGSGCQRFGFRLEASAGARVGRHPAVASETHGVGLDEDEDIAPTGPGARQRHPEEAVGPAERRARATALENDQLLAPRQDLQGQRAAGAEGRPGGLDEGEEEREHGQIVYPVAAMGKCSEGPKITPGSSFGEPQGVTSVSVTVAASSRSPTSPPMMRKGRPRWYPKTSVTSRGECLETLCGRSGLRPPSQLRVARPSRNSVAVDYRRNSVPHGARRDGRASAARRHQRRSIAVTDTGPTPGSQCRSRTDSRPRRK